jgi:hypothetical protein
MMGIRSNQSPVAIPDPTDLYRRVFLKSIRNDNPDDYSITQRKLKAIKGYVSLKLYFTFSPDLYESFFKRTYQELLSEFLNENSEAGSSISASNIFRHKRIVDIDIVRLAGVGPAREFLLQCKTFNFKLQSLYKTSLEKYIIPIGKLCLFTMYLTLVSDFSQADRFILCAIPAIWKVFYLHVMIALFYLATYLHDIYGKSKHFQLEKRVDLKKYYNRTNEILIDSFMEYPLDWFMRMEGYRRIQIRIG